MGIFCYFGFGREVIQALVIALMVVVIDECLDLGDLLEDCLQLAIRDRLAMSELLPLYPQHATFQRQCRISASFRLLVLQLRACRHGGVFVVLDPEPTYIRLYFSASTIFAAMG